MNEDPYPLMRGVTYAVLNISGTRRHDREGLNSSVMNGAMVSITAFSSRVGSTSSEQDLSGRARTAVTT